jgi:hypothetical protein
MAHLGVEWGGRPKEEPSEPECNERDWPMLCPADRCDGTNPMTGRVCAKGHHQGYHRDVSGAEWLDDGDMANPDWRINPEPAGLAC